MRLVAPNAPQAALGMIFFTFSAAAALTVWVLRRTDPLTTAIGGCLSVLPTAVLTLSGLHGAGLPTVYGGAALAAQPSAPSREACFGRSSTRSTSSTAPRRWPPTTF